jgi:hypothetical protein
MSKTELRFEFQKPFEDGWAEAIRRLHSVYGFLSLRLAPDLGGLTVLYDASRLTPDDVEHHLRMAGLPVRRAPACAARMS